MNAIVVHCTEPLVSTPALFDVELDEFDDEDPEELAEAELKIPPWTTAGAVVLVVFLAASMYLSIVLPVDLSPIRLVHKDMQDWESILGIDRTNHSAGTMSGNRAVEPDGGGVVDSKCESFCIDTRGGRQSATEEGGAIQRYTWLGERSLGDGVFAWVKGEHNGISGGSDCIVWIKN